MTLRRFWLGLATVSGLARRGFFIPHRYAAAIPRRQPAYDSMAAIMAAQVPAFRDMLESIDKLAEPLLAMNGPAPQPRWDQDWFPRADGAAAYTLVRHLRPARIVEVGSGHSTRFLMRAVVDEDFSCAFTAIDPAPRAAIDALPLTLERKPLQQAGVAPFAALKSGDVLFIDSSHILMPGTDVDLLFNRVLPRLPAGVFVHIHDILLPDDYPESWAWRGYNEQLAVATLLQGGAFAPIWSSHFAATRMTKDFMASVLGRLPLKDGAIETSLWLQKL